MKIKTGDNVIVLSGKDKGKTGKVLRADPKGQKVIVEGVNVATKHQRPPEAGRRGRHHQDRDSHLRFQAAGGLPQVRQGDPRRS